MTVLIIGTADSGKSQKAEALAIELARDQTKYYIATMIPFGEEGARRVEKHRKYRKGKGFVTIEKPTAVHELSNEIADIADSTCLLECMSNLIGNEMHTAGIKDREQLKADSFDSICYLKDRSEYIVRSVMELGGTASNLIIVTNSFPTEDASYDEETKEYVNLVSLVNAKLLSRVDKVYELFEGEFKLCENH